ncbi:MAG: inositol-3-phosphate synthase, partial [Nitrososphaera sp.]
MGRRVKVAIAGVGNCASALVQGSRYYRNKPEARQASGDWIGLTAYNLGGIEPADIDFVAAFDVATTKVGK